MTGVKLNTISFVLFSFFSQERFKEYVDEGRKHQNQRLLRRSSTHLHMEEKKCFIYLEHDESVAGILGS